MQMSLRALVIFLAGLLMVRIAGRRSFGVREPFDNVLSILLGATLSRCVVGASDFLPTITASFVMVIAHQVFGKLGVYSRKFGWIVKGEVKVLFENGKLNRKNMWRCNISERDIMSGVRTSAQVETLDEVKIIYLERNGKMSVIKKDR
jgi:uncharacterized membrane protein YcaP (DUF421 family)